MSPPRLPGRHRLEAFALAVQHTDAGRAETLVAGKDIEIAVERSNVDRHVGDRLRAIDQDRYALGVRQGRDPGDVGHAAQGIGNMCHRDQARARAQQTLVLGKLELPGFVDRHHLQHRPGLLADLLPRHDVGVMFHRADEDLVARHQQRPREALGNQIDRLRGSAHEDDLFRGRGMEKDLNADARRLKASVARWLKACTPRWTLALSWA